LQNATLLKGRIALIERGLCTFQEKAKRALNAGAIGIIFANSEDQLYQPCVSVSFTCYSCGGFHLLRPNSACPAQTKQHKDVTPIPMLCIRQSDAVILTDGMAAEMIFKDSRLDGSRQPSSHQAAHATSPQHVTAKQRVFQGAHLQEWTRGKHTGTFLAGDAFVQVTPAAEITWKNKRCRIKRVQDGFTKALSLAKPAESNSKCGFTVRVESDEQISDVYDLELMAPSDHVKMQWISGILEVVKDQLASAQPKYTGEKVSGIPKGKGLGEYPNGDQYMGEWESGFEQGTANGLVPLPHGRGVFAWRNTDLYRGEWDKGVRSGHGTLEISGGAIYQGQWADDRMNGSGIQMLASKEKYVGSFLDGFRHGPGVITQQDGIKKSVEYMSGVEINKGPFPHPNATIQANLAQVSKEARNAAKSAGEKAEAAQALCESAEGLINQVASASNSGSPQRRSTFSTLQKPATIPPSIPSTPGSIRPAASDLAGAGARGPSASALASMPNPARSPSFLGSPIAGTGTPQTPYTSMGAGGTMMQSPPLGVVGR
jgi:hypothetical protein